MAKRQTAAYDGGAADCPLMNGNKAAWVDVRRWEITRHQGNLNAGPWTNYKALENITNLGTGLRHTVTTNYPGNRPHRPLPLRVSLRELRAEQENLCRVINPNQQNDKGAGGSIA